MRTLIIALLISLIAINIHGQSHNIPETAPIVSSMSTESAKAYCDSAPLRDPEGIYIWPESNSLVLIRASSSRLHTSPAYEIIVLESDDILLEPGQTIGYLYASASPADYHLYIYKNISHVGISRPQHIAAEYDSRSRSFSFKQKKIKFSFNPLGLIPRVRSLLRISTDNPVNEIPRGLVCIYPAVPSTSATSYPRYF